MDLRFGTHNEATYNEARAYFRKSATGGAVLLTGIAISQLACPQQDDPGIYAGYHYTIARQALVTGPVRVQRFSAPQQVDLTLQAVDVQPWHGPQGKVPPFQFSQPVYDFTLPAQSYAARTVTLLQGRVPPFQFASPQNVDLTIQAVDVQPWHGPQGPVPPFQFAQPQIDLTLPAQVYTSRPVLPIVTGVTVRPTTFTNPQVDTDVNRSKVWAAVQIGGVNPNPPNSFPLPNFVGIDWYTVSHTLISLGLNQTRQPIQVDTHLYPHGIVTRQDPAAGTFVTPTTNVQLTVSRDYLMGAGFDVIPWYSV